MRTRAGSAVAVLCGVQFLDVMGVTSAVAALPAMLAGVDAPQGSAPLLAGSYAALFGGLLMLGAQLGDRYGHRRVLLTGTVGFSLVGVLGATAADIVWLVVARGLQGVAAALSVPCALTLLLAAADPTGLRRRALAAWSASGAAAGAAGLLLGGVLTDLLGWPAVFWLNVPVGLGLAVAVRAVVPDLATTPGRAAPNWLASLLVVAAVVLGIAGSSLAEVPQEWTTAALLGAGALAASAVLVIGERRSPRPLLPPALAGSANLWTGSGVSFVNTATTSSAAVLASLFLQEQRGLPAGVAGLSLLPLSLAVVAGAALSGPLGRRLAPRRLAAAGLGCTAIGVALPAVTGAPVAALVAGVAVAGLGLGVASVAGNDLGTDVGEEVRGLATGVLNTAAQLGTALGVAVLLVVASLVGPERGGTAVAWLAAAGLAGGTAVALLRAPRTIRS